MESLTSCPSWPTWRWVWRSTGTTRAGLTRTTARQSPLTETSWATPDTSQWACAARNAANVFIACFLYLIQPDRRDCLAAVLAPQIMKLNYSQRRFDNLLWQDIWYHSRLFPGISPYWCRPGSWGRPWRWVTPSWWSWRSRRRSRASTWRSWAGRRASLLASSTSVSAAQPAHNYQK